MTDRPYAGYQRSESTGLDYAVNRYYSSGLGQFLQPDPLGLASINLRDPQTLNPYTFVRNDPVNDRDPLGLDPPKDPTSTCPEEGIQAGVCVNGVWIALGITAVIPKEITDGITVDPNVDHMDLYRQWTLPGDPSSGGPDTTAGFSSLGQSTARDRGDFQSGGGKSAGGKVGGKKNSFAVCRDIYLNNNYGGIGASAIRFLSPLEIFVSPKEYFESVLETMLVKGPIFLGAPILLRWGARQSILEAQTYPLDWAARQDLMADAVESLQIGKAFNTAGHGLGRAALYVGEFATVQDAAAFGHCLLPGDFLAGDPFSLH